MYVCADRLINVQISRNMLKGLTKKMVNYQSYCWPDTRYRLASDWSTDNRIKWATQ